MCRKIGWMISKCICRRTVWVRPSFAPTLWFRCGIGVMLVLMGTTSALGQGLPVRLEGSLSLASEFYSASGIDARRPSPAYRAFFSPTLVIGDQIRLPFTVYVTNTDRGFRQPLSVQRGKGSHPGNSRSFRVG